jgi:uncharacterized Fe-S cluster-containing radical SAM superfamily protein
MKVEYMEKMLKKVEKMKQFNYEANEYQKLYNNHIMLNVDNCTIDCNMCFAEYYKNAMSWYGDILLADYSISEGMKDLYYNDMSKRIITMIDSIGMHIIGYNTNKFRQLRNK